MCFIVVQVPILLGVVFNICECGVESARASYYLLLCFSGYASILDWAYATASIFCLVVIFLFGLVLLSQLFQMTTVVYTFSLLILALL